jgi:hypothetical protein
MFGLRRSLQGLRGRASWRSVPTSPCVWFWGGCFDRRGTQRWGSSTRRGIGLMILASVCPLPTSRDRDVRARTCSRPR